MDIVFPKPGTEKSFVQMAERLGIDHLILAYPMPGNRVELPPIKTQVKLSVGQIVTTKTRKFFPGLKILTEPDNPRAAFEQSKADIICNLELQNKPDFIHHRASGFNHVMSAIAAKRGKKLGINFSNLLSDNGTLTGRVRQNIKLARKAKVEIVIFSGATTQHDMRSEDLLRSVSILLGC